MSQLGKFITVEGTEGVGKSTNIGFIKSVLETQGIEVVLTREPGGTPLAEELRSLLLSPRDEHVHQDAEILMVFAARAQHLNQVILPALQRGAWVLSDRFTDATFAYQGMGRGIDWSIIAQLEALVQKGISPDLTVLLDMPVELGMQRALARSAPDRFEQEKLAFFEKVRKGYHQRVDEMPSRFAVIDASQSLEAVQQDIKAHITERLGLA
jgi:dTMP kinase